MLAFVMTALLPQAALGDRVCFDIVPNLESSSDSDNPKLPVVTKASRTDTTNEVCVWNEPSGLASRLRHRCVSGISTETIRGRSRQCVWFPNLTFLEEDNIKVVIKGDDALWIDRLIVIGEGKNRSFTKQWGTNDTKGLCMSTNIESYTFWNNDRTMEHVPSNTCYAMLRFNANGSVDGANSPDDEAAHAPVLGENGMFYGRKAPSWTGSNTVSQFVSSSGKTLEYKDGSGPVELEQGDWFTVDANGWPTVRFADGLIIGPEWTGRLKVVKTEAPQRRTEATGEEEIELSVEDAAGPFLRLAALLNASKGL